MTYDVVFSQPVYRNFRASTCSYAYFAKVFFLTLEMLLPLIFVFSTHGLWKKYGDFRETPQVSFEGRYILLLNSDKSNNVLSSSFPVLNLAQPNRVLLAQETWFWSSNSQLNIQLRLPIGNGTIESLMYIVFLKCELSSHSLVEAELALMDTVRLSSDTQRIEIKGQLAVDQARPFSGWRQHFHLVNGSRQDFEHYKPAEIAKRIAASDISLFINRRSEFRLPRFSSNDFTLSFDLHVAEDSFTYKTNLWELLKWAWVQYLALFVVVHYFSQKILTYLFCNNVIEAVSSEHK